MKRPSIVTQQECMLLPSPKGTPLGLQSPTRMFFQNGAIGFSFNGLCSPTLLPSPSPKFGSKFSFHDYFFRGEKGSVFSSINLEEGQEKPNMFSSQENSGNLEDLGFLPDILDGPFEAMGDEPELEPKPFPMTPLGKHAFLFTPTNKRIGKEQGNENKTGTHCEDGVPIDGLSNENKRTHLKRKIDDDNSMERSKKGRSCLDRENNQNSSNISEISPKNKEMLRTAEDLKRSTSLQTKADAKKSSQEESLVADANTVKAEIDLPKLDGPTDTETDRIKLSKQFLNLVKQSAMVQKQKAKKEEFFCTYEGCNRKFAWKWAMEEHAKTHMQDDGRVHVCNHCGKGFFTVGCLKSHVRIHTRKPLSYVCKINGCGKKYSTSEGLRLHTRNHHDLDKKWKCPSAGCGKSFVRQSDMRLHIIRIHSQERPYPCDTCAKSFACYSELKRHEICHQKKRENKGKSKRASRKTEKASKKT